MKSAVIGVICAFAAAMGGAQAAVVISGGTVSSPQGDFGGGYDLVNITNQSGLSGGYVSGVTDFDSYAAATTHDSPDSGLNSGFTDTSGLPQIFTFDLGASYSVDGLAFWSTDNIGSVTSFELFTDSDTDFGNGGLTSLGVFNPVRDAGDTGHLAQVFMFALAASQFFHISVLDMDGGTGLIAGIGEIVFRGTSEVPVPAAFLLFPAGLAAFRLSRGKKRGTA